MQVYTETSGLKRPGLNRSGFVYTHCTFDIFSLVLKDFLFWKLSSIEILNSIWKLKNLLNADFLHMITIYNIVQKTR